jgi:hypothetical protein
MNRREFGQAVAAAITAASQARPDSIPWYRRTLVGIEVGPTGANNEDPQFFARASGREMIASMAAAHAEYAVVFMKDQDFAYYNSRVAEKCPALGERDLLAECIEEAKKHSLPVVAYCQVQYDSSSWRKFPEFRMHDAQDREIPDRLCFNSGYLDRVKQFADEMMEYAIAGFHFDMLDQGFGKPWGCWCGNCQRKFRARFGMSMPKEREWNADWEKVLQFRYDSSSGFAESLRQHVRNKRPELSVDFNYHGYPPFDWQAGERPVQHAAMSDFVTAEGLPWAFGYSMPSFLAMFLAAANRENVFQCVTWRGVREYHDYTVRPVADLKSEVMRYLAHGATCTIVDKANYDGTLDREAYRRIGEVFADAGAKRQFFGHEPVAEVGLYFSARNRDWYGQPDATPSGAAWTERLATRRLYSAILGAHLALTESHISCGILLDENLSLERLRDFAVAYLPDVGCLGDREIDLLRRYVDSGGKLIATGQTGLFDPFGRPRRHAAFEELVGARLVRALETLDHYVVFPEQNGPFQAGLSARWPMLTWGPASVLEPAGATVYGELWTAYRTPKQLRSGQQPSLAMSPKQRAGAAMAVNRFGRGEVVYLACSPDAAWGGEYHVPEHRSLIRNVVRYLNRDPMVEVEAPPHIEVVIRKDAGNHRLIVHLIAGIAGGALTRGLSPHALGPMEDMQPYTARVKVRGAPRVIDVAGKNVHEVVVVDI